MAYCSSSYFLRAYDSRRLRELLSDTGVALAEGAVADDENLAQILAEASEMIAAAVMVGKRYSLDMLDEMAADTEGGYLLKRLCADLAYGLVCSRRGQTTADVDRLAPRYSLAQGMLTQLASGATLFPTLEEGHPEAGLPSTVDLNSQLTPGRAVRLTDFANRAFPRSCDRQSPRNGGCC